MSTQTQELRKFEFSGLMKDIAVKNKGSKSCKDPHTAITILTRPITNEEMDALCYGGCYGYKIRLSVEVVRDPKPLIKESTADIPAQPSDKVLEQSAGDRK